MTNKIACLYSYYEKNDMYINNVLFFMNNAILPKVDYFFIINGNETIDFNQYKKENIHFLYRDNEGFDFGAYADALTSIVKNKYDYYFFINTSVIGPCFKDETHREWTDYFIELFTNEDVKVVGTSINTCSLNSFIHHWRDLFGNKNVFSHVQSMFFCIKHDYLDYLNSVDFFNTEKINKLNIYEIVCHKEVGLSQLAINNGWNINSILSKYKGLDYRNIHENINTCCEHGDPYYPGKYFNKTIDKYEAIFFKNNRF